MCTSQKSKGGIFIRKIISIALVLIMLLNTTCFAGGVSINNNFDIHSDTQKLNDEKINNMNLSSVEIVKIGEAEKHLKYYREDRGYSTHVVCSIVGFYENDIFHPAYCMNKNLPGAEDGNYEVNIKEIMNNPKVWRVISNGYPYKTYQEMGLECMEDAFAVTKFAIYCVLGESKIEYYSAEETDLKGQKMLEVLKTLVEYGNNESVEINQGNIYLEKIGEMKEGDVCYYQEYKVSSDINMTRYNLYNLKNFPEGSYVANAKNIYQGEFNVNENFRILIPKENVIKEINGEIEIGSSLKNYPIFYGVAPEGRQNYILTYDSYGEVRKIFDLNLKINTGKIKVIKIDEDTKENLEGVKFELINENTLESYIGITDEKGEIYFDNLYPGKYILKEFETLENYKINEEELEIEIKYNSEIEIIVENKKISEPPKEEIEEPEIPEEIIPEESEKIEEELKKEVLEENKNIPEIEVKLPKTGM